MMKDQNNQPADPDILVQATDSLLASPIPAEPSQDFQLETLRMVEDCRRQLAASVNPPGQRRLRMRLIKLTTVAATLVVLIGGLWLILGHGASTAFANAIDKVAQHEVVRFRVQTSSNGQVLRTCLGTVNGRQARVDNILGPGTSWIIDNEARAALILNRQSKVYQKIDMSRLGIVPVEALGADIRQELLGLRDKTTERMGNEQVDGVTADKYATQNGKAFYIQGDWNVWISRDSGLPVRVSVESKMPQSLMMSNIYDSFEWDPKLDADTFSLNPPEGYQERKLLGLVSETELPR